MCNDGHFELVDQYGISLEPSVTKAYDLTL